MFYIYLRNWIDETNNTSVLKTDEEKVLSIPFDEETEPCMINPIIKGDMGKAESLDFTVNPGMKYYNAYQQLKTIIRITMGNTEDTAQTIFFGQVKTINTSTLLQVKQIHAEGAYTMLSDTPQEGIEEEHQIKQNAIQKLINILNTHNAYVQNDEPWKIVNIGICEFNESDPRIAELKKRDSSSWTDTLKALDDLIDNHGGYMRLRLVNNQLYLDWFRKYYQDLGDVRPSFVVTHNIIDLSSSDETGEVFTRIIPIGHKETKEDSKESSYLYLNTPGKALCVNDPSVWPTNEECINNFQSLDDFANAEKYYGVIYKTVDFPNADSVDKLLEYSIDWIKKNYYGPIRTFTIKALDMHMVGANPYESFITIGDCVNVIYPIFDQEGNRKLLGPRRFVCKSAQYNLFNPEQNTYTVGIPNDAIDFEYGTRNNKKKGVSGMAASADGRATGYGPKSSNVITWTAVLYMLKRFYCTYNWGSLEAATAACAYSWRHVNGKFDITKKADLVPYSTFNSNGELFLKSNNADQSVSKLPAQDGEGNTDVDPTNDSYVTEKEIQDKPTYVYRNFTYNLSGKSKTLTKARVMGHYKISKCPRYNQGAEYGVGYHQATNQVFAFFWGYYLNGSETIPISFFFPKMEGSTMDEQDLSDIIDVDGNGTWAPISSDIVLIDPETGLPNAEIFPDSGTAHFGTAYHWEDENGNRVEFGTPGAHRVDDYDENGNPIWFTTINTPIRYQDNEGTWHTLEGCIIANDIQLPDIPSFKTQLAVITNLIAGYATIGELRAYMAILGSDWDIDGDPFEYEVDENGDYILDANGNKIPVKDNAGRWKFKEGTRFVVDGKKIFGAAGKYYIDDDGNIVMYEGGGLKITRNNVQFGIWDKGELDAGIFAKKEGEDTYTEVRGDYVTIGTGDTKRTLAQASEEFGGVLGSFVWEEYWVDANGNEVPPGTPGAIKKRRVKGLDGGGSLWLRDENGNPYGGWGIWHQGNLDSGIFTKEDGSGTYTEIRGDRVIVGQEGQTKVTVMDAMYQSAQIAGSFVWEDEWVWVDENGNIVPEGTPGARRVKRKVIRGINGGASVFDYDQNGNPYGGWGLWHKGNLDAGIFSGYDENGTYTEIRGDRVIVGQEGQTKVTVVDATDQTLQIAGSFVWDYEYWWVDENGNRVPEGTPGARRVRKKIVKGIDGGASVFSYDENGNPYGGWGLWHKGNLDAGIFTGVDSDGKYTEIRGDKIIIGQEGNTKVVLTQATEQMADVVGSFTWDWDEWWVDANGNPVPAGTPGATKVRKKVVRGTTGRGSVFTYDEDGYPIGGWGFWTEGNLDAGIFTGQDANGKYTEVRGDYVTIGTGATKQTIVQATEEYAQVVGGFVWDEYWVDSNGNTVPAGTSGATKKRRLKGLDGSGSVVLADGSVATGIWTKGELDAGMFAGKNAEGKYTEIRGDYVYIGTGATKKNFLQATEEYAQVVDGEFVWEEYWVDSNGNTVPAGTPGATKKRRLKGLNGSGSVVLDNGTVATGIWAKGELNAGMVVEWVNDETQTTIKGSRIKIGSGNSAVTLTDAIEVGTDASGHNGILAKKTFVIEGNNAYVLQSGGTGGNLTAHELQVGLNGSLIFDDRQSQLSISKTNMGNVFVDLAVVPSDSDPSMYVLKGKRMSAKDVSPTGQNQYAGWIDLGTFRRAASTDIVLTGSWSGGSNSPAFPLIVSAHPKNDQNITLDDYYVTTSAIPSDKNGVVIGISTSGDINDARMFSDSSASTGVKFPIAIVKVNGIEGNEVLYTKNDLLIPAWPLWDKAATNTTIKNNPQDITKFSITVPKKTSLDNRTARYNTFDFVLKDSPVDGNNVAIVQYYDEEGDLVTAARYVHNKYNKGQQNPAIDTIGVALDRNYLFNGNIIDAVVPTTSEPRVVPFLQVKTIDSGLNSSKKRTIETLVGSTPIFSKTYNDYKDGQDSVRLKLEERQNTDYQYSVVIDKDPGDSEIIAYAIWLDVGELNTVSGKRIISANAGTHPSQTVELEDYKDGVTIGASKVSEPTYDMWTVDGTPSAEPLERDINTNTIRFKTTLNGSIYKTGVRSIALSKTSFDDEHKAYVYIREGTISGSSGDYIARTTINASSVFNAGAKSITDSGKPLNVTNNTQGDVELNRYVTTYNINVVDTNTIKGVVFNPSYDNNGTIIKVVEPSTDPNAPKIIRIWTDDSGLNKSTGTRNIIVRAASAPVETLEINDYAIGLSDGADAVSAPTYDAWTGYNTPSDDPPNMDMYTNTIRFKTTLNGSKVKTGTRSIALSKTSFDSNHKAYVYIREGTSTGSSGGYVARATIDATTVYQNGADALSAPKYDTWTTAPTTAAPTTDIAQNTIRFKTTLNNATVKTGEQLVALTLTNFDSSYKAYVYLRNGTISGPYVGRVTVDASSVHNNAAKLANVSGSWSNGTFTAKNTTTGSTVSYSTTIADIGTSDISWSGYTGTINLKATYNNTTSRVSTGKTLTVNAQQAYNNGFDAVNAPYLESWTTTASTTMYSSDVISNSTNAVVDDKKAGGSRKTAITISTSPSSWNSSNNTIFVYTKLYDSVDKKNYYIGRRTIDATVRYKAGWDDALSYTSNNPASYSVVSLSSSSSDTVNINLNPGDKKKITVKMKKSDKSTDITVLPLVVKVSGSSSTESYNNGWTNALATVDLESEVLSSGSYNLLLESGNIFSFKVIANTYGGTKTTLKQYSIKAAGTSSNITINNPTYDGLALGSTDYKNTGSIIATASNGASSASTILTLVPSTSKINGHYAITLTEKIGSTTRNILRVNTDTAFNAGSTEGWDNALDSITETITTVTSASSADITLQAGTGRKITYTATYKGSTKTFTKSHTIWASGSSSSTNITVTKPYCNLDPLGTTGTRTEMTMVAKTNTNIFSDTTVLTLEAPTSMVSGHYVVNLKENGANGTRTIGRINLDTAYDKGVIYGWDDALTNMTVIREKGTSSDTANILLQPGETFIIRHTNDYKGSSKTYNSKFIIRATGTSSTNVTINAPTASVSNLNGTTNVRIDNITVEASGTGGLTSPSTILSLEHTSTKVNGHFVVNLKEKIGSTTRIIGRINTDIAYKNGWDDGLDSISSSPKVEQITSSTTTADNTLNPGEAIKITYSASYKNKTGTFTRSRIIRANSSDSSGSITWPSPIGDVSKDGAYLNMTITPSTGSSKTYSIVHNTNWVYGGVAQNAVEIRDSSTNKAVARWNMQPLINTIFSEGVSQGTEAGRQAAATEMTTHHISLTNREHMIINTAEGVIEYGGDLQPSGTGYMQLWNATTWNSSGTAISIVGANNSPSTNTRGLRMQGKTYTINISNTGAHWYKIYDVVDSILINVDVPIPTVTHDIHASSTNMGSIKKSLSSASSFISGATRLRAGGSNVCSTGMYYKFSVQCGGDIKTFFIET